MMYLSLIVPAYNEARRVASTLRTVDTYLASLGRPYEIIAVDDGSADDTHQVMLESVADIESVRVISYEANRGKGYAVRQGVLASRGEYVAFSDTDLSAPIEQMGKLFEAIEKGYDIAIGSRAAKGAEIPVHQPLFRELGGRGLNLIIRALAVPGISDTQCGFKLFRGDLAREIFGRCFLNGWVFDVEVLYLARKMGCSIAEVPVRWSHVEGSSVRPIKAGFEVIRDIIKMRLHRYEIGNR